uniref:NADH dehydrogenase subunit 6 n=1 Tax=Triplax ainonia TaxID=2911889 RepID=UPI0022373AD6|nr:NADH dehydrogenase subunit 6 [Triplax ainonia]UYG49583.1 NADH dehydrogenase subunit 6 [Triplax ainonia]
MLMMLFFMMILSMIFMFLKHPLSFGGILLMQAFMVSVNSGLLMFNYWYSYILFLIMIGGMLILFLYMTSIASNEKFYFSTKLFLSMLMISLFILILFWFLNLNDLSLNMSEDNLISNQMPSLSLNTVKYVSYSNIFIFMILISYLFITLIAVVKITGTTFGPLRQKF